VSAILFLDFDGVLHPVGGGVKQFTQLPLLEALLRDPAFAGVSIVVSSTWRELHSLKRLQQFFNDDLRARVIGVTPVLDEYDSEHERYEEIRAWLDEHAGVTVWAALDDDIEGFPAHHRKRAVFTDPESGLKAGDLERLRLLLQG
jgi:hypothetical protein